MSTMRRTFLGLLIVAATMTPALAVPAPSPSRALSPRAPDGEFITPLLPASATIIPKVGNAGRPGNGPNGGDGGPGGVGKGGSGSDVFGSKCTLNSSEVSARVLTPQLDGESQGGKGDGGDGGDGGDEGENGSEGFPGFGSNGFFK